MLTHSAAESAQPTAFYASEGRRVALDKQIPEEKPTEDPQGTTSSLSELLGSDAAETAALVSKILDRIPECAPKGPRLREWASRFALGITCIRAPSEGWPIAKDFHENLVQTIESASSAGRIRYLRNLFDFLEWRWPAVKQVIESNKLLDVAEEGAGRPIMEDKVDRAHRHRALLLARFVPRFLWGYVKKARLG